MQTERMTMAQALVRFLNQQYVSVDGDEMPFVEGVATIFGHGNVLGIGQALEQDPGHLQVMQGCNEQGIAHMATGFAKQHRRQRIFAVTSSVGPGAANMVTAAATATANRIPLLLLLYNGQRGHKSKWFQWGYYLIYPIHFIVLYIIELLAR